MKRIAGSVIFLVSAVLFVCGQTTPPPKPGPTPYSGRSETAIEKKRRMDREFDMLQRETSANLYGQASGRNSTQYNTWRAAMISLYRKPNKTETKMLRPNERFRRQHSKMLREKDSGLFKLIPYLGCAQEGKVVDVSPDCLKYNFPGSGSSYSFRTRNYRIRRLADITLIKNSLIARGALNGAIFVELGDIAIEDVNLSTPGVGYLAQYKPVKNAEKALEAAKQFAKGVKRNGFVYGRGVFVTKNNTFAMRSIAYRGKLMRSEAGIVYNELDFDKRRDIVVVFRILEVEEDGSATIVWKGLRQSKSPKIKMPESS